MTLYPQTGELMLRQLHVFKYNEQVTEWQLQMLNPIAMIPKILSLLDMMNNYHKILSVVIKQIVSILFAFIFLTTDRLIIHL